MVISLICSDMILPSPLPEFVMAKLELEIRMNWIYVNNVNMKCHRPISILSDNLSRISVQIRKYSLVPATDEPSRWTKKKTRL